MRITATIEFDSMEDAARFFANQTGATVKIDVVKADVVKADAKPTTAKAAVEQALATAAEAKEKKKAEADAAAAAAENTDDLAGGDAPPVLDYDTDVKPKFQAFLKAKGRDAGLALLGKYGAKSGAELPKDRLHEVLADIEAAG